MTCTRRALLRTGGALLALTGALSCAGPAVWSTRIRRVGVLTGPVAADIRSPLLLGLSEYGFDASSVSIDWQEPASGREELFYPLAMEMAAVPVDVIVANGTAAQRAAKRATSVVPIVIVGGVDPVAAGIVESLARPGGNVTGLAGAEGDVDGKRLELLIEVAPSISRVAIVSDDTPTRKVRRKATEEAARRLGISFLTVEVHDAAELPLALEQAARDGADALVQVWVGGGSCTGPGYSIAFAAARGIPAAFGSLVCAEAGGLLTFGVWGDGGAFRQAGNYVARILKGEKPAEMPLTQPTLFDLIVNLKTARKLGIPIPQSILSRATRVIE